MQLNAKFGVLSDWRLNAPAGICIVCGPCVVTGELLKWKVICVLPPLNTKEFAGIPFTVKSLAWTVAVFTASVRLITKSVGWVLMMLLQAGVVVVTAKPTSSLSVKASCWDAPLMALRPSTHEVDVLGEYRGAVVVVARIESAGCPDRLAAAAD